MRNIAFKTTVEPVTELLTEQLQGALQIIAALVLTDEECLMFEEDEECQPDAEWVRSMRAELLSPDWRPDLIAALKKQGFLTNTHPGFPLGALTAAPPGAWALNEAYMALEPMLQDYAEGKGDEAPKDYQTYWKSKLVEAGHDPEIAAWVLKMGGAVLACEAAMERLIRPVRNAAKSK